MTHNILELNNLSKTYKKRPVVRNVSLTLKSGEIVGLLGPNGAGKTTTFTMAAGLTRPDNGNVSFNKEDITELPMYVRSKIGIAYLPQESSIFRGLTVEQNILLVLELIHNNPDIIDKKLEELLAEFSISHLRYTNAMALSGGERRRLEIARTIAMEPSFILLDEPLAGIDPIAVSEVKKLIQKLQNKNIGILITDHNVRETLDIVDRAYIIYDGNVLMQGNPQDIVESEEVQKLYLGKGFKF